MLAFPLLELAFLIRVGSSIGAGTTVLLVIATAVIGIYIIKLQGTAIVQQARLKMSQGEQPASEVMQGVMLALAGVLLMIPGFISDIMGFILLVPSFRMAVVNKFSSRSRSKSNQATSSHVIEGEYERHDQSHR